MFERFITDYGYTGGNIVPTNDGGILIFAQNIDKSYDDGLHFVSSVENTSQARSVYRLKSGELIGITMNEKPEAVTKAKLNGSTFNAIFSYNDGLSWTKPNKICRKNGCYYVHNDRILQLSNGRILIPANWLPEEFFENGVETSDLHGSFYSDDNGKTWQESNWISAQNPKDHLAESIAVELSDGTVKAFMRSPSGYVRQSISYDNGQTWEPETGTSLRMPCAPFTVKKDPYSDFYFVIWTNCFPAPKYQYPRSPISLGVSRDETLSWEPICELDSNPQGNYGYPALFFTLDHIIITYYVNEKVRNFRSEFNRIKLKILDRKKVLDLLTGGKKV